MAVSRDDIMALAKFLDKHAEGEKNTRRLRVIARCLRMNERHLQHVGQALVRSGYPLCTSCSRTKPGWYKATDLAAWTENIRRREHRRDEISVTIAAAKRAARFVGTGRLFELDEIAA